MEAPSDSTPSLKDYQVQIQSRIQSNDFENANRLIEALYKRAYLAGEKIQEDYRRIREEHEALKKKFEQAQEPPYVEAIYLMPAHHLAEAEEVNETLDNTTSESDLSSLSGDVFVVGIKGQRWIVQISPEADFTADALIPGQRVWVTENKQRIIRLASGTTPGRVGEVIGIKVGVDRLRIRVHGNEEILVQRAGVLVDALIEVGDRVLFSYDLGIAFELLPKEEEESRDLMLEKVPDVTYAEIGGLRGSIEQIREAIERPYLTPALYQEYRTKPPKGVLLHGPPGCGKTMIAKAIANELSKGIQRNLREIRLMLHVMLRLRHDDEAIQVTGYALYLRWLAYQGTKVKDAESLVIPSDEILWNEMNEIELQLTWDEVYGEASAFLSLRRINIEQLEAELAHVDENLQQESHAWFMSIKGPELLSKWVGETENSIRQLFKQARKRARLTTPVVIFFDELDALFQRRGSRTASADMESTIVPQFLSEIDGIEELSNVIIIGATNRMDRLDEAILRAGRLSIKIEVSRPTETDAEEILRKYLNPIKDENVFPYDAAEETAAGSRDALVEWLIKKTANLLYSSKSVLRIAGLPGRDEDTTEKLELSRVTSGAMLELIVNRAKELAMKDQENHPTRRGVRWEHLRQAVVNEIEENKKQYVFTRYDLESTRRELAIQLVLGDEDAWEKVSKDWLTPIERLWN